LINNWRLKRTVITHHYFDLDSEVEAKMNFIVPSKHHSKSRWLSVLNRGKNNDY